MAAFRSLLLSVCVVHGLGASACFAVAHAQVPAAPESTRSASSAAAVGRAVKAEQPPVLDGRDTDDVWQTAPVIDQFREVEPSEDGDPAFRTAVRVAYDERNLYVMVRAFDPHPDSLLSLLSRRDVRTTSDRISVLIDAYHDRLTGVALAVNPAGVKLDASIYSDFVEDLSWDGVWDVATAIDSLGWTAEFRVPFSQLRFGAGETHTFGFGVWREIARRNERVSWPLFRRSRQALASQLGDLEGIAGVRQGSRLELLPYAVTKNVTEASGDGYAHPQQFAAGIDLKYGVTQNLTLDATVNPDFGQVEADPAVLNLTAFEIRFEERRPFFLEGAGLYKCRPCQGLFYTRRIGRTPQLRASPRDPISTTILGATKLTGRSNNGFNAGIVEALTDREVGESGTTIEPRTNYFVGRLMQEFRGGRSSLGGLVASTYRWLDETTAPLLRENALAASVDAQHRFWRDRWEVLAYAGWSRVTGTPEAIALTQRSSVHLYQRPDDDLQYDPTRTRLDGVVSSVVVSKIAGVVRTSTWFRRAEPGVEFNDVGLVPNVNDQQIRNDIVIQSLRPRWFYRRSMTMIGTENHWTIDGMPSGNSLSAMTHFEFRNSWGVMLSYRVQNPFTAYCVSCARGGPAVRQAPRQRVQLNVIGDARNVFVPRLEIGTEKGDDGRTSASGGRAGFDLRIASRFSMSLDGDVVRNIDDQQWIGNFGAVGHDTTHYTFARLRQTTVSMTARASWTATPTLSLQLYAQPFVSSGSFTNWRELGTPRAESFDARFRPYGGGTSPRGFNVKQFNSNAVLRWEYSAGSTLFLVWQQGRNQADRNPGTFEFVRDYHDLFEAHPINTFLLKVAYWVSP